jgi:hypothetical protein
MSSLSPNKPKLKVGSTCEKCGLLIFSGWPHKCAFLKPKKDNQ